MPDQEHATTGQAGDAPEAGPRVLVVEDDTTSRLVVARQLDRLGVAATVVGDGTEAVEAVRQGRFDAVLMDRHLPGVDGRSEEHTSELQSRGHLVCRLL